MVYALGSWLPKLMIQAGYSLGASMIFLFALNIGGMVGAIGGGALADRFHLKPVLTTMFTLGAIALILLGFNSPQMVLYGLIAIAGAATIGSKVNNAPVSTGPTIAPMRPMPEAQPIPVERTAVG